MTIKDDHHLAATLERLAWFARVVAHLRTTEAPADFLLLSNGYLTEIRAMNDAVLSYLQTPADEQPAAVAVVDC
jgi:hypothetical protein